MRSLFGIVALVACLVAAPVVASDGRIAIDGYDYVLPAPRGYCADGAATDVFQARVRARIIKPGQRRAAMLTPCGVDQLSADFYIVQVSPQPPTTRDAYLTLMRRTMPVQLDATQAGDPEQIGRRLAEALRDRSVNATKVHPVGVNNICALSVSQVGRVTTGTIDYTLVACASVIQKRIVYVFRYVAGTDFARVNAALLDMPRMLESIRSDATT